MGKVSIGMLGWRFDEADVLTDEGEFRPLEEMPPEDRERINRLDTIYKAPCNACWLIHGNGNLEECNTARYVYGEPLDEVILCEDHEPDFVYWYQHAGGSEYRDSGEFEDAFFEWFDDGGRAPAEYEGMEYVETDPEDLPAPPSAEEEEGGELTDEEIAESGVDFGSEYPT